MGGKQKTCQNDAATELRPFTMRFSGSQGARNLPVMRSLACRLRPLSPALDQAASQPNRVFLLRLRLGGFTQCRRPDREHADSLTDTPPSGTPCQRNASFGSWRATVCLFPRFQGRKPRVAVTMPSSTDSTEDLVDGRPSLSRPNCIGIATGTPCSTQDEILPQKMMSAKTLARRGVA